MTNLTEMLQVFARIAANMVRGLYWILIGVLDVAREKIKRGQKK